MNTVDYSPDELLNILNVWEEFVGTGNKHRVRTPQFYPQEIVDSSKLAAAKKVIKREIGLKLQTTLKTQTFSKKAEAYLTSVQIREAVDILLKKSK